MIPFDQIQAALARLRGILGAYFDRRAAARIERRTRAVRGARAEAAAAYATACKRHGKRSWERLHSATNRQLMIEMGK